MVKICLQCGDKGFSNALVYCVNCLQCAVHRYCLNKLPATLDEFVYWVCDDCDVETPQHFGSLNTVSIQLENGDYINSKHGKANSKERSFKRKTTGNMVLDTADNLPQHQSEDDDFPWKKIKKSAGELFSGTFMKKLENFPKEKAYCQAYTENKLNDHVDSAKLENKHSSPLKAENKMKHKKKNMESAINFSSEVLSIGHSLSEYPCESNSEGNLNECMESTELEKKNASVSDPMMKHNRRKSGDVNAELDASVTYNQGAEFCPLSKSNNKKRIVSTLSTDLQGRTPPEQPEFGPGHLLDDGTLCNSELAQPLADPIWRGSFNVLNREYDKFEEMAVNLSNKVCERAYEEETEIESLKAVNTQLVKDKAALEEEVGYYKTEEYRQKIISEYKASSEYESAMLDQACAHGSSAPWAFLRQVCSSEGLHQFLSRLGVSWWG